MAAEDNAMNLRRFLLAAMLVPGVLAAWSAVPASAASLLDDIRARGVLRVGTTGDYKPFTFREPDGSLRGADIDMARRLAAQLGVKVEFVPAVWASLNQDFAARKFDIAMGGVTILPARSEQGVFTQPVFVDGKRPIVRCADRDRFTSIAAINRPDVRVVVNPGATNEQFARASFPDAKLTVHRDNASVFDEIRSGRADVMVTDGIEVDHQAHIHADLCAAHVAAPFTRLEKAYWVQRDAALDAAVATWLESEMKSGSWTRTLDAALVAP
jgi:cyclohexadienyl dehydratase